MIHFFFQNYALAEERLHLHADKCSGQNKNSAMLWYLLWRVTTGLNTEIKLSFLRAGHTKFSPDCGFGLIKRKLRRTRVSCLQDFEDVVNSSSVMNCSQRCGDEEGNIAVPTFDWTGYLGKFFSKVVNIKRKHHLLICHRHSSRDIPGFAPVQCYSQKISGVSIDAPEQISGQNGACV